MMKAEVIPPPTAQVRVTIEMSLEDAIHLRHNIRPVSGPWAVLHAALRGLDLDRFLPRGLMPAYGTAEYERLVGNAEEKGQPG